MRARSRRPATLARLALAAAALGGAGAASGCGSHPHRGLGTEIDRPTPSGLVAPARIDLPDVRRVAVGSIELLPSAGGRLPGDAGEEADGLPIDTGVVRRALRDLLAESGAFDDVRLAEDAPRPGDPAAKGVLFLDVRLRGSLRRTEEDGTALRLVVWFFLGALGAWQHDRAFDLDVEPEFILRDGETGRPLAQLRAAPGHASDRLSLHERREGAGAFVATFFFVPYFVFASTPERVAEALAPEALAGPVNELLRHAADLRPALRVQEPVARGRPGVRVELLEPTPRAVLAGPSCDVAVRVTVRPEAGELAKVFIDRKAVAATGPRVEARVRDVPVSPGRPIQVKVQLLGGEPFVVLEIPVEKELAPPGRRTAGRP